MESRKKGFFLVLISSILWGLGGVAGQIVFEGSDISTPWLIAVRMIFSGVVLIILAFYKDGFKIFDIFKNSKDIIFFMIYCFMGNWLVQYSYFEAINYSNAATATLMQYLSPGIVLVAMAVKNKKMPTVLEVCCVVAALTGLYLISTHGSTKSLAISSSALIWGIISALALTINSTIPIGILKKYGAYTVTGFAMLIGGITTQVVMSPFSVSYNISGKIWCAILFVIIFGTAIPFAGYSAGIKIVGGTTGSIVANFEPLTAAVISVLFLDTVITGYDVTGFCLIIGVGILLAVFGKNTN